MGSDVEWRWAEPNGQQRLVREDELRAALVGGLIPANAPVWRAGWREWQPAYAVPELATASDVPPPPLGVLGAQKALEKEGASRTFGNVPRPANAEPPPPPRYVPAPPRTSHAPPTPPPPSSRRAGAGSSPGSTRVDGASERGQHLAAATPSSTLIEGPSENVKGASAEESNTGVLLLDEEKAGKVLAANEAASGEKGANEKELRKTVVGVPTLPQSALPSGGAAALAVALTPHAPPTSHKPGAPPLPTKTSKPPPPPNAKKKGDTLLMQGAAVAAGGAPAPAAQPTPAPPPAREAIEELSGSLLVEDRDRSSARLPAAPTSSPDQANGGGSAAPKTTGTLLGFPVPTAPSSPLPNGGAQPTAAEPPPPADPLPPALQSTPLAEPDPHPPRAPSGLASSKILHDLREIAGRTRPKNFWAAAAIFGAAVVVGLLGVVVGAARDEPAPRATSPAPSAPPAPGPIASASVSPAPVPSIPTPLLSEPAIGGPCTLAGTAHTIAPRVLVPGGVEVGPADAWVGIGFSVGPKDAMAAQIDPGALTVVASAKMHVHDPVRRAVADTSSGHLVALAEGDRKWDRVQGRRLVPGPTPIDVGIADGAFVYAPHLKDEVTKLWDVEGDGAVEALRGTQVEVKGERGIAVAFRRGNAVWMGAAFGEKTLVPRGPLVHVAGLGPVVGSPTIASEGDTILVAWADRASPSDPWSVRWVTFKPGEVPPEPARFRPPGGGLGDQAMSPWLTAVGARRFLFTWTEGPVSAHQVRAQTLGLDGATIGDAFTVSSEGTNAGQAQSAVLADGRGVVAYLASRGKVFEVVATPLVCPPAK